MRRYGARYHNIFDYFVILPKSVPIKNKGRIAQIDALRGIAALLVLWLHVAETFVKVPEIRARGTWLHEVIQYVDLGRLGISLFFAISGFVICQSIRGHRITGTRKFIIRRVMRLYPAFWVSLIFGTVVLWIWSGRSVDLYTLIANATMVPALLNAELIIGLYWTLELELFFYFLVAILFIRGLLHRIQVLLFLAVICLALFGVFMFVPILSPSYLAWKTMPYHLSIMLWGVLFRYWYDDRHKTILLWGNCIELRRILGFYSAALCMVAGAGILGSFLADGWDYLSDGVAYLLTFMIFWLGVVKYPVENRLFAWLGTISYSIYLFHPVVLVALKRLLSTWDAWWMSLHLSFYLMVTVLLTVPLAAVIYYSLEKPMIAWSYKISKTTRK